MNKKIIIFVIVILIFLNLVLLINKQKNNKKIDNNDVDIINNNLDIRNVIVNNLISGQYEVYENGENGRIVYSGDDPVQIKIYSEDTNFDLGMPET